MRRAEGDAHVNIARRLFCDNEEIRVGCICAAWLSGHFNDSSLAQDEDPLADEHLLVNREHKRTAFEEWKEGCACKRVRLDNNNEQAATKRAAERAERLAAGPDIVLSNDEVSASDNEDDEDYEDNAEEQNGDSNEEEIEEEEDDDDEEEEAEEEEEEESSN